MPFVAALLFWIVDVCAALKCKYADTLLKPTGNTLWQNRLASCISSLLR